MSDVHVRESAGVLFFRIPFAGIKERPPHRNAHPFDRKRPNTSRRIRPVVDGGAVLQSHPGFRRRGTALPAPFLDWIGNFVATPWPGERDSCEVSRHPGYADFYSLWPRTVAPKDRTVQSTVKESAFCERERDSHSPPYNAQRGPWSRVAQSMKVVVEITSACPCRGRAWRWSAFPCPPCRFAASRPCCPSSPSARRISRPCPYGQCPRRRH